MIYEEAVDQYMNGYCMYLAAALHHRYGFRIGLLAIDHGDGERLSHAWVVTPEKKCLDIQGEQTLKQVSGFYGDVREAKYKLYKSASLAKLEKLAGTKLQPEETDVKIALAVAQRHLEKELQKWE